MYLSALPWAREAKVFGHKAVGDWTPSGAALLEEPLPIVDNLRAKAARDLPSLSRRQQLRQALCSRAQCKASQWPEKLVFCYTSRYDISADLAYHRLVIAK